MNALLALPIVVPLLAAALTVVAIRAPAIQRALTIVGVMVALGASIALLVQVDRHGPQAIQVGGWPAPLGITLVDDLFSCLMLVVGLATVHLVGRAAARAGIARDHLVADLPRADD